ncbi:MAG: hypothetical protein HY319_27450 [Armatimonadetes bacterium]|nr:hypothetical protein [Armatimonadota bacterium]
MNETWPARVESEPHPLLEWGAFYSEFPGRLASFATPAAVRELLTGAGDAPLEPPDAHREAIRRMMRQGGFKPSGRSKPASEYLSKALEEGRLESINAAVDCCNAISLRSGIPISVVDAEVAVPPFALRMAPAGTAYVFNPSGQEIRLDGLICLYDAAGPCGSAVKDSQRTKTGPQTRRTLSVIWGSAEHAEHTRAVVAWYRELLKGAGVETLAAGGPPN